MMGLAAAPLQPVNVSAGVNTTDAINKGINAAGGNGKKNSNLPQSIKQIVNILLFVIGAAAVIVIVIGGLRYVLSGGDSTQVSSAKNTILYAVIGLVVAILAYAIVNFVVDNL